MAVTGSPSSRAPSAAGCGEMKILAILQNQYFKDPEHVKAIFARHPDKRNDLVRRFLFAGCLTGKRLLQAFGESLCQKIVWEEASKEIGGISSSVFKADAEHIAATILEHKPDIVIVFGKVAQDGLTIAVKSMESQAIGRWFQVLHCPHPTARPNPLLKLREVADKVKQMLASPAQQ